MFFQANHNAEQTIAYGTRQSGFTIAELLIAVFISLILAAGILTTFSGVKTSFTTSSNFNLVQDSGFFGLHTLSEDLRMAGYWGINVRPWAIDLTNTEDKNFGCGINGWATKASEPIAVLNDPLTSQLPDCIEAANHVDLTDVLLIRRVGEPLSDRSQIKAGSVYVNAGIYTLKVFIAASDGQINAEADFFEAPTTMLYPLEVSIYYVRECGFLGDRRLCSDTYSSGGENPTLVRLRLKEGSFVHEPISENIEDLQVVLGVDNDSDGIVDQLGIPSGTFDFSSVASVEVSLLVRAPLQEGGYKEDVAGPTDIFNSNKRGSYTYGGKTSEKQDAHRRQVFSRTIYLRNERF